MLRITIPYIEQWDSEKEEFSYAEERTLQIEHSLVSLSKWESKWCKPFLSTTEKTVEEQQDYIRCMTITQNVDPDTYQHLTSDNIKQVTDYINASMTATTIKKTKGRSREIITAEIIYYWMVSFNIPFECQKWHLNRLITLVQVCNEKNQPPKKGSRQETLSRNAKLNAERRARTKGKG